MAATYQHGQAHQLLASAAGDLLERFTISTKLSPRPDMPPLAEQAERATTDLGTAPAVMLLHNPEHLLRSLPVQQAARWWSDTADVMAALVAGGLCRAWGIACWDPRPLLPVLATSAWAQAPQPAVVMARAGLLVPASVLTATEKLRQAGRDDAAWWGMSPFAGDPTLLEGINVAQFLADDAPRATSSSAGALAVAFHVPTVSRIAVGASSSAHLDELADAATLAVDEGRVSAYRQLLTTTRTGSMR